MPEARKICPSCQKEIHSEAIKCRFCHADLNSPADTPAAVAPPSGLSKKARLAATLFQLPILLGILCFPFPQLLWPPRLIFLFLIALLCYIGAVFFGYRALREMTPAEKTQSVWKKTTKGYAWIAMVGGALFLLVAGIMTLAQIVAMANMGQDM